MGGEVSIHNETPYYFTYCFSYRSSPDAVWGHAVLSPRSSPKIPQQPGQVNFYIKYGQHNTQNDTRYRPDMHWYYNPYHCNTFYIREYGHGRSLFQLSNRLDDDVRTCPNYGKQEADRRQEEERRRQEEEEERRRQEERRRRQEEERRRQQQMERERRIQQEIENESRALEEKQAQFNKKLDMKMRQLSRVTQRQKQAHILRNIVEDDALPIQTNEVKDVGARFNELLIKNGIVEDEVIQSRSLTERMITLQYKMISIYAQKKGIMEQAFQNVHQVFGYENLSLTEHVKILKALTGVALTDPTREEDTQVSSSGTKIDEKTLFLISVMDKLFQDSKTTAGNIVLRITQQFTDVGKEQLTLILFNGIWNPVQTLTFYLETCNIGIAQDDIEKILHHVQTYRLGVDTAISALRESNSLQYLSTEIKKETDKDVKTIIQEMRHLGHSDTLLNFLENVLEKLMNDLPQYEDEDLDAQMKQDVIKMIGDLDLANPNLEAMLKILTILSVAVEDTTSVPSDDPTKKAKGYFPRATQLAAVLTLLLSDSQEGKGRLLEIATGEGKSCIVALFALIHAIRGKKVDIVTSSPVLARRDAEEWKKLYEKFDVTCSVIPPPRLDGYPDVREIDKAIQHAYNSQIVYGTVEDFAADILRQEFERKSTRNDRKFDIAIVDEVDYMTLDNGVQITFLSHDATGMRHLDQLLTAIWAKLHMCQKIMEESGDIFWAPGIQYFHKLATDTILGQTANEHFSSLHILKSGVEIGLFTEEDLKDVSKVAPSEADSSDLQNRELEMLIGKFGPQQQKDVLKVLGKILNDSVQFKFYELEDEKASFIEYSCDSGEPINVLLLPGGKACLLMTKKQLVDATVEELSHKIKYSDEYKPMMDKSDESVILLPKHLKEYTKNRLPVFVESALQAIVMENGREYTIDSRDKSDSPEYHSIIPIDFKSTGVLEKNKRWGDGLQQFLELKHKLAISPISTVTNFMSNFHFFQRYLYGSGVYGVSGTLGDKVDFRFLQRHFKVYSYLMPTHRFTKKLELPVVQVKGGREAWIKEICMLVQKRTSPRYGMEGQCVLVVCEDVKTAEELQNKLSELKFVSGRITLYTRSDKHNVDTTTFQAGDVILATNLGGRGTDFKVTKGVNKSGGLSVILTHFPANRRVEKQIFGRTSRKGNPGMVQMVLNMHDLAPSYQGQTVEEMRELRQNYEKERIADMENDELVEINTRHELFTLFCKHLKILDSHYSKKEKQEINRQEDKTPKMDYHPALNSLKESWALWLTTHEDDINDHKDLGSLKDNLSSILETKSENLLHGRSENFYDYIKVAMDRTFLHMNDKKNDFGALPFWEKIESADNVYRAISLYNRALIVINMGNGDYKTNAITLLTEAKTALGTYASEICNIHAFGDMTQNSRFEPHNQTTNFALQKETKMQLLNSWKTYIENAVAKLEELNEKNEGAITEETSVFMLCENTHSSKIKEDELSLLYDYGLPFVFEVKQKPRFCFDALFCCILGALQVLAGVLICGLTCGAASQFGLGLISEGISDMLSGIEGMIKGTFDWAEWAISKAISIGLSLVTAGFNLIKKVGKAIFTATKDLLNGTRTFGSLARDVVKSGKTLLSSVKSGVTSVTKSFTGLATRTPAKQVMKETAKYAGKELVKKGLSKISNYVIDEAVKAALNKIFEACVSKKIETIVKSNKELEQALIRFIVTQAVPLSTLQKQNPQNYIIPENNKKQIKMSTEKLASSAMKQAFSHDETYKEVLKHLGTASDFLIKILESEASSTTVEMIKLSATIVKFEIKIANFLQSVPIESIVSEEKIPHVISGLSEDNTTEKDDRSNFKDVLKLKDEIQKSISEQVTKEFIDILTDQFSELLKATWEIPYVQKNVKKMAEKAGQWLKKTPKMCFQIHQTKSQEQNESNPEQSIQIKAEDAKSYITKLTTGNCQNIDLELRALTNSDLMEGRGIKMTLVQMDGVKISSDYYPGNNPQAETIELQVMNSTQSQQFRLQTTMDGTVSRRWSDLYDTLSHAIGRKISDDVIKASIHNQIQQNPDQYLLQISRDLQREEWRKMAAHYTMPGHEENQTDNENQRKT